MVRWLQTHCLNWLNITLLIFKESFEETTSVKKIIIFCFIDASKPFTNNLTFLNWGWKFWPYRKMPLSSTSTLSLSTSSSAISNLLNLSSHSSSLLSSSKETWHVLALFGLASSIVTGFLPLMRDEALPQTEHFILWHTGYTGHRVA